MQHPRATRLVEALHAIILLMFLVWVPFCFWAQPPMDDKLSAEVRGAEVCNEDGPRTFRGQADSEQRYTKDDGSDEDGCGPGCERWGRNPFSLMPFMVALGGGGVFSLEAFEAFPML